METFVPHYKNLSINNIVDEIDGGYSIEQWRDVEEFGGAYLVSNFGRVKSVKRQVSIDGKYSYCRRVNERIIKLDTDSQGYVLANLWKQNKGYTRLVHRLVAQGFIPNPKKLPEVNHEKGNKQDNRVCQLSWITTSDNQKHSYVVLKRKGSAYGKKGVNNPKSVRIKCDTLDMYFDSVTEAAEILGVCQSAISWVLLNKRKHTAGLVFKYAQK